MYNVSLSAIANYTRKLRGSDRLGERTDSGGVGGWTNMTLMHLSLCQRARSAVHNSLLLTMLPWDEHGCPAAAWLRAKNTVWLADRLKTFPATLTRLNYACRYVETSYVTATGNAKTPFFSRRCTWLLVLLVTRIQRVSKNRTVPLRLVGQLFQLTTFTNYFWWE